jgi:hypothetical protein
MRAGALLVESGLRDLPLLITLHKVEHGLLQTRHLILRETVYNRLALLVLPDREVFAHGIKEVVHALVVDLQVGDLDYPSLELLVLGRIRRPMIMAAAATYLWMIVRATTTSMLDCPERMSMLIMKLPEYLLQR